MLVNYILTYYKTLFRFCKYINTEKPKKSVLISEISGILLIFYSKSKGEYTLFGIFSLVHRINRCYISVISFKLTEVFVDLLDTRIYSLFKSCVVSGNVGLSGVNVKYAVTESAKVVVKTDIVYAVVTEDVE